MKSHATEMNEGTRAFERFRDAMKAIVSVPKAAILSGRQKARTKRKKPASHKS